MAKIKRIGLLTGGGDAPGLNAVIRAIVKTSIGVYGWEVVGIEDGFEGLIGTPRTVDLGYEQVRGLLPRGGSILGCTNKGHFVERTVEGKVFKNDAAYREAIDNLRQLAVDALIVIGGEGSHHIACEFHRLGVPVIGVPKTIDDDLSGTELTFGFASALACATEAIDRLHTTAESHDRVMLVEVMGRHTGWIAMESGMAGGADVVLIPEVPFYLEKASAKVLERERLGRKFSIIVVAEGAVPAGGSPTYAGITVGAPEARLGGLANQLAPALETLTGKETRVVVLAHLQRGGSPTAFDRVLASCYGSEAVRAAARGEFGSMVAWRCGAVVTVSIEEAIKRLKAVPPDHFMLKVARDLGMSFAGEED